MYNNAISFTSLGAKIDKYVAGQKGIYTFRVSGQLTHNIGSALPESGARPAYSQIFMLGDGGEQEVKMRADYFKNRLKDHILLRLQNIMLRCNPYAMLFKNAAAILKERPNTTIVLKSLPPGRREKKTYNKPRPTDVGAIVECDGELDPTPRHVLLHRMSGARQAISDLNTFYFGVRYPILLPFGSQMWDEHVVSSSAHTNNRRMLSPTSSYMNVLDLADNSPVGYRDHYNVSQLEWLAWMLF